MSDHLERVQRTLFAACVTLRASPSTHWEDAIATASGEVTARAGLLEDGAAYREAMDRYRAARKADGQSPKHMVCMAAEFGVTAEIVEHRKALRAEFGLPSSGLHRGRLMIYLTPDGNDLSGDELGDELTVDDAVDALLVLHRLGIRPDHITWVGQVGEGRVGSVAVRMPD